MRSYDRLRHRARTGILPQPRRCPGLVARAASPGSGVLGVSRDAREVDRVLVVPFPRAARAATASHAPAPPSWRPRAAGPARYARASPRSRFATIEAGKTRVGNPATSMCLVCRIRPSGVGLIPSAPSLSHTLRPQGARLSSLRPWGRRIAKSSLPTAAVRRLPPQDATTGGADARSPQGDFRGPPGPPDTTRRAARTESRNASRRALPIDCVDEARTVAQGRPTRYGADRRTGCVDSAPALAGDPCRGQRAAARAPARDQGEAVEPVEIEASRTARARPQTGRSPAGAPNGGNGPPPRQGPSTVLTRRALGPIRRPLPRACQTATARTFVEATPARGGGTAILIAPMSLEPYRPRPHRSPTRLFLERHPTLLRNLFTVAAGGALIYLAAHRFSLLH
jgi:hypothetical protein